MSTQKSNFRGPGGPFIGGVLGVVLGGIITLGGLKVFEPSFASPVINVSPSFGVPYTPDFGGGLVAAGHKTGTGNFQSSFKSLNVKPSFAADGTEIYVECARRNAKTNKTTVRYEFFMEGVCEVIQNEDVSAVFKFFNGNEQISPDRMTVTKNEDDATNLLNKNSLDVGRDDYQSKGEICFINFTVSAEFPILQEELDNTISVVFEIYDGHSNDNTSTDDEGRIDIDCEGMGLRDNTLQYYQCIEAGGSHQKDHIEIIQLGVCVE